MFCYYLLAFDFFIRKNGNPSMRENLVLVNVRPCNHRIVQPSSPPCDQYHVTISRAQVLRMCEQMLRTKVKRMLRLLFENRKIVLYGE